MLVQQLPRGMVKNNKQCIRLIVQTHSAGYANGAIYLSEVCLLSCLDTQFATSLTLGTLPRSTIKHAASKPVRGGHPIYEPTRDSSSSLSAIASTFLRPCFDSYDNGHILVFSDG